MGYLFRCLWVDALGAKCAGRVIRVSLSLRIERSVDRAPIAHSGWELTSVVSLLAFRGWELSHDVCVVPAVVYACAAEGCESLGDG
jgi:hypothetical protein